MSKEKKKKGEPRVSRKSLLEEKFLRYWLEVGDHKYRITRNHRFHDTRKWRFDFAFPTQKVAVEIEGGVWAPGRMGHSTGTGIQRDCEKYNEAVVLGWRVLRYTSLDVSQQHKLEEAIKQVISVLRSRVLILS